MLINKTIANTNYQDYSVGGRRQSRDKRNVFEIMIHEEMKFFIGPGNNQRNFRKFQEIQISLISVNLNYLYSFYGKP